MSSIRIWAIVMLWAVARERALPLASRGVNFGTQKKRNGEEQDVAALCVVGSVK